MNCFVKSRVSICRYFDWCSQMVDCWNPEKRSEVMSLIRSNGNVNTELRLIAVFRLFGITGWRRKQKIYGKPDFVFRKQHLAVFVDGCFWHGCPKCYRRPLSNQQYWDAKIIKNKERDRKVNKELRRRGWRILRVWECSLKHPMNIVQKFRRVLNAGA